MSLSITYATTYASWTIADYLADWAGYFGDANHRIGEVEEGGPNTGGFYPGSLSGTQYSLSSQESDAGFIAGGTLQYSLFSPPAHTVYGTLDSISLGTDVVYSSTSGFDFAPGEEEVSFDGLGLSSLLSQGHDGVVHKVIYGLMSGDATELDKALDTLLSAYGVDTDDTFDVVAAALAAGPLSVAPAEAVGVQAVEDYALAA